MGYNFTTGNRHYLLHVVFEDERVMILLLIIGQAEWVRNKVKRI